MWELAENFQYKWHAAMLGNQSWLAFKSTRINHPHVSDTSMESICGEGVRFAALLVIGCVLYLGQKGESKGVEKIVK